MKKNNRFTNLAGQWATGSLSVFLLVCQLQPVFAQDLTQDLIAEEQADSSEEEIMQTLDDVNNLRCQENIDKARTNASALHQGYKDEFGYFWATQKHLLGSLVKETFQGSSARKVELLKSLLKLQSQKVQPETLLANINKEILGIQEEKQKFLAAQKSEIDKKHNPGIELATKAVQEKMAERDKLVDAESYDKKSADIKSKLKKVIDGLRSSEVTAADMKANLDQDQRKISELQKIIADRKAKAKEKASARKEMRHLSEEIKMISKDREGLSSEIQSLNAQQVLLKQEDEANNVAQAQKIVEISAALLPAVTQELERLNSDKAKDIKLAAETANQKYGPAVAALEEKAKQVSAFNEKIAKTIEANISTLDLNSKIEQLKKQMKDDCSIKNIFASSPMAFEKRYKVRDTFRRFNSDVTPDSNCVEGIEAGLTASGDAIEVCNTMPVRGKPVANQITAYRACSVLDLKKIALGTDAMVEGVTADYKWKSGDRSVNSVLFQLDAECADAYKKARQPVQTVVPEVPAPASSSSAAGQ